MRTGLAHLPLHGGKAPRWLFSRMVRLSREMVGHLVEEHGPDEVLRRLSDPFWFQAFGCLLGFDWHSSVGAKTVRALALAAELIHGTPASTRDPARFSFAHGGKDGHPFPVDIATYEATIEYLRRALDRTRVDHSDKVAALKRLDAFPPPPPRAATA